jgi:hypothetical protein
MSLNACSINWKVTSHGDNKGGCGATREDVIDQQKAQLICSTN